jgi:hypothetical protein
LLLQRPETSVGRFRQGLHRRRRIAAGRFSQANRRADERASLVGGDAEIERERYQRTRGLTIDAGGVAKLVREVIEGLYVVVDFVAGGSKRRRQLDLRGLRLQRRADDVMYRRLEAGERRDAAGDARASEQALADAGEHLLEEPAMMGHEARQLAARGVEIRVEPLLARADLDVRVGDFLGACH